MSSFSFEAAGTVDQVGDALAHASKVPDIARECIANAIATIKIDGSDELDVVGTHGVRLATHGTVDDSQFIVTIEMKRVLVGAPKITTDEYNRRAKAKADAHAAAEKAKADAAAAAELEKATP